MPSPRSLLVLAHAASGSADDASGRAALDVLRAGAEVEVVTPSGPEETRAALRGSAGREVVVLGGDGAVHGCVNALAELGLLSTTGPVAIVPMGTGNDFARTLGLPLDPAAAARVALDGAARELDLLRGDDGGLVVNVVHAGVGAEATAGASAVKGLLGITGYAVGALRAGLGATGWCLRVTVDGKVLHDGTDRLLMVTVGLGGSIGGGAPVAPQAAPVGGSAAVVIATATAPLARAGFALALRRGEHTDRDDVETLRGREITVEAVDERNAFRVSADGEVGGAVLAAGWRVEPRAWRCRVPAEPGHAG